LLPVVVVAAWEPSTQASARTALRKWFGFNKLIGDTKYLNKSILQHRGRLLVEEDLDLCKFAMYLVIKEHFAPGSAKTYVSYIRGFYVQQTGSPLGVEAGADSRLNRCFTGLKKISGHVVLRKKAILLHQVVDLLHQLRTNLGDTQDCRVLLVAIQVGFQGMCRKSEYSVTPTHPFAVSTSLTMADVEFRPNRVNPEVAVVRLKKTKTDRFLDSQPELILPFDGSAQVNACKALKIMLDQTPIPEADWPSTPLFVLKGAPLKGGVVHRIVQAGMGAIGLNPSDFGSHSLRSGGATALADAGCPEVVIKTLGRWSSEVYRIYVRTAFNAVLQWGCKMGDDVAVAASRQLLRSQT
jgi:integrase